MAIYLDSDRLTFDFSDYHPDARMSVEFQRTLRIPDDGKHYPLPPGFRRFTVRHVEDYGARLPESWLRRGGVLLPMYQTEAMWVRFKGGDYPFAVKIAAGKVNAVTGEQWSLGLNRDPQDYMVVPGQPWLDGFCVEKGIVRQFVAMPLGKGYTAEEQVTGHAAWGGIQIAAYPIKRESYVPPPAYAVLRCETVRLSARVSAPMGLAPGGKMRQEIYRDHRQLSDWDQRKGERCFVGILNSEDWHAVTGEPIPSAPLSAKDYAAAGLPWFDYYSDQPAVQGSAALARLKAIGDFGPKHGMDDDGHATVPVARVIKLGPSRRGEVRAGEF